MGRPRQSAQGPQPSCRSRAPSASWPRSHGTCPPRSPKKTGRSCLACSTADHIAEDPLGRQPTTGIMARTDAASSRNTPGGSARGTRRVRLFCLTAQVGPRWADRSRPPTEQARQHNIPGGAANELLPSTPNTPRLQHITTREISLRGSRGRGRPSNRLDNRPCAAPTSVHPARSPRPRATFTLLRSPAGHY